MNPLSASLIGSSFILSLDLNQVSLDIKKIVFFKLTFQIAISNYMHVIYSNRLRIYLTVFLIFLGSLFTILRACC